jgi:UDP-glucose 4-epimerase
MKVLVTGGAGFIGSHTCVALAAAGHQVAILDNFSNASRDVISRISAILGFEVRAVDADVRDQAALSATFASENFDALIHFASLKSVAESITHPLDYWSVNVGGAINVFDAALTAKVKLIVFSSSATVYDTSSPSPLRETAPLAPASPYAHTKLAVERLLQNLVAANPGVRGLSLRYFNPVGAYPSGLIGESPLRTSDNLFPALVAAATGARPSLSIFMTNDGRKNGTGVRDFIHVMDVAEGHVRALEFLSSGLSLPKDLAVNLGTGIGTSVADVVLKFQEAIGRRLEVRLEPPRPHDPSVVYADATLARSLLNWSPRYSVGDACRDTAQWLRLRQTS